MGGIGGMMAMRSSVWALASGKGTRQQKAAESRRFMGFFFMVFRGLFAEERNPLFVSDTRGKKTLEVFQRKPVSAVSLLTLSAMQPAASRNSPVLRR